MKAINFYHYDRTHACVAVWDKSKSKYKILYANELQPTDVHLDDSEIEAFKESNGYLYESELNQINIFDL